MTAVKVKFAGAEHEVDQDLADRMVRALEKAVEVRQWQDSYFAERKKGHNATGILQLSKEAERALDKLLVEFTPKLEPEAQAAIDFVQAPRRHCPKCGGFFVASGASFCPHCLNPLKAETP